MPAPPGADVHSRPEGGHAVALVRASHVYKVFGPNEKEVIRRIENGEDRDDLRELGTAAVIDASFEVERGEIFVVMGLSGSGKSTLIRTLNGLWSTSSGSVEIAGKDISKMNATELRAVRRDHISMVFQHFALMPHHTVRENAAYSLELQGMDKAERLKKADKWLEIVGLKGWEDKYPSELSGGMQQRVGLARALAAETDILLMDEAFSALDPLIRREMQQQLAELQHSLKKTIIFITHDLNEAMYLGDRIAVMRNGRIAQIGTAEDILTNPADDYVASFIQDVDRSRVYTAQTVMRPPTNVVHNTVGPNVAIREMQNTQESAVLVTDRSGKLLGLVTDDDAVAAAKRGERTLDNIIYTKNILTCPPDAQIADLFAPSAEAPVPLCVIDEAGKLLGVVPRVKLLQAMGTESTATGELPAVSTVPDPHPEPEQELQPEPNDDDAPDTATGKEA